MRHTIRKQQQYKAAMQQIDSKQIWHKRQLRIEIQYAADRLARRDGVTGTLIEPSTSNPIIIIVQHANRIPLPMQQDMQDMQNVRTVCRHQLQP